MRDLLFVRPSNAALGIASFSAAIIFEAFGILVFQIRYPSMAIFVMVGPEITIIIRLPFAYNHVSCHYDTLRGIHIVPYRHASCMPCLHCQLHQTPGYNSYMWRISVGAVWEPFVHE